MSVFSRLAPRLQEGIVARLGWSSLRPVQEQAGEALLAGANAVILARTAGGKTEAPMFPTISQMVESAPDGVGALYIAPIKALLNNLHELTGFSEVGEGSNGGGLFHSAPLLAHLGKPTTRISSSNGLGKIPVLWLKHHFSSAERYHSRPHEIASLSSSTTAIS